VSTSRDGSCIIWDVQSGSPLRTFLLTSSPISLAVDPCDRAFYVGFEDGSIQLADLFKSFTSSQGPLSKRASDGESEHPGALLPSNPLYIPQLQTTPITLSLKAERWISSGQEFGPTLCLDVLFEGNYVLSGHQSGKVIMWDAAKGRVWKEIIDFQAPVTNLIVLPPIGFPTTDGKSNPKVKVHTVTKPRYESSFASSTGVPSDAVPANYVFAAQFSNKLETPRVSATQSRSAQARDEQSMLASCIDSTSFPPSILSAGIAELSHWPGQGSLSPIESEDRGNTGGDSDLRSIEHLRQSNRELWAMVYSMRNIQKSTWEIVSRLRAGQQVPKAVKRRAHRSDGSELSGDGIGERSEKESDGSEGESEEGSDEGVEEIEKDTHMGNAD
jgi:pre-rRNA-processing protein IPI3